jgi:steroid 5-alpha reductase family enzyme
MAADDTESAARAKGFLLVIVAYLVSGLVGCVAAWALRHHSIILAVAVGDVAATVAMFGFSLAFNNSSFYDVYWSIAPMVIAAGLFRFAPGDDAPFARRVIVLSLVMLWGARLTWNWVRGWGGLKHEDWRYVDLRAKTGNRYWLASFFGLHLFPTVITFLGGLALFPALSSGHENINIVDGIAAIVTVAAIVVETTADEQLRNWRKKNRMPGRIMADGLWSLVRHPNYVGEMMFWWGLCLFGIAADSSAWWTLLGPIAVTGLIAGVSVRMIDKRSLERRPDYAEHMKNVPAFIPRLFRG